MDNGIRILLLTALVALAGCAAVAQAQEEPGQEPAQSSSDDTIPPPVIEPDVERRKVEVPEIRSSDIEVGISYGALSIEDFDVNPVYAADIAYHVTEDFFMRADLGRSTAGKTSFETISQIPLLTNSERVFTYYDVSLGYNFLPGEVFLGSGRAMVSDFYILAGVGGTKFAGDTKFTLNVGGGYQVVPTDWLALHIDVEDRIFQSNLLGVSKLTDNLEVRLGTSVYF